MKPAIRRWDDETLLVAWLASCVALIALLAYLKNSEILLYGDAVAHINIARRVFDSRTPGLLQLGTVWLPMPHLLMIPFIVSDWMWQTGVGGSIPSILAYILGVIAIFRLMRGLLSRGVPPSGAARLAAWMSALIYAANPNLIYLQSTAMTEALYQALFLWTVVYFVEFVQAPKSEIRLARSSLYKCGWCVAVACFTRYDGWFLGAALSAAILFVPIARGEIKKFYLVFAKFLLLVAMAPGLWLGYNAIVYGNALEFANGPYSARAIERQTSRPGSPPHPGSDHPTAAAAYFLKAGELMMLESAWHRVWLALALAGALAVLILERPLWPVLLLWVPLPFYAFSVAYGGVPIFVPPWWPFSYYNVRYGLQLLPAFAVFAVLLVDLTARYLKAAGVRAVLAAALMILAGASYAIVWKAQPVCFREAWVNSRTRVALETELSESLRQLPPDSTFLMYLGAHPAALERAAISLRRVIYEGNHRTWKQPSDPEGLWERALADPASYVNYVIESEGDPVAQKIQMRGLTTLLVIHVSGQPPLTIYKTSRAQ